MEQTTNDTDRGMPKYSGKNLFQYHFLHHKSNKERPGIEPGIPPYPQEVGG
jgi:hypothetical protein